MLLVRIHWFHTRAALSDLWSEQMISPFVSNVVLLFFSFLLLYTDMSSSAAQAVAELTNRSPYLVRLFMAKN